MLVTDFIWYKFFSWWIFTWFILYHFKVIKLPNPLILYILIIPFGLINIILIKTNKNYSKINYGAMLIYYIIWGLCDVMPVFILNKELDINAVYLGIILGLVYMLYLKLLFNNAVEQIYNTDNIVKKLIYLSKYFK